MRDGVNRYRIVSLILSFWSFSGLWGQEKQSVYLQSERDMFYSIQYNGATYNSTRTGFLEIPGLSPGTYTWIMGFPESARPEYAFQCVVSDKPISFVVRLAVDNSWNLFNMVDFTVTRGAPATKAQLRMAARLPGEPKPGIKKIFDKATPGGVDRVYVVMNGNQMDTVALFIPAIEQPPPQETGKRLPFSTPEAHDRWAAGVLIRNHVYHKTSPNAALFP
jgi:hypothetical protein